MSPSQASTAEEGKFVLFLACTGDLKVSKVNREEKYKDYYPIGSSYTCFWLN